MHKDTIKLTSKGQLTLPKEYRDRLGLDKGCQLVIVLRGNALVLKKYCPVQPLDEQDPIWDMVGLFDAGSGPGVPEVQRETGGDGVPGKGSQRGGQGPRATAAVTTTATVTATAGSANVAPPATAGVAAVASTTTGTAGYDRRVEEQGNGCGVVPGKPAIRLRQHDTGRVRVKKVAVCGKF